MESRPILKKVTEALTLWTLAGALIGSTAAFLGIHFTGPRAELARLDSTLTVTIKRTDSAVKSNARRIDELEENERMHMFMLCIITRRVAPDAVPLECGQATLSPRHP